MPKLSPTVPFVHPGCQIVNSTFGQYCEVGEGSRVLNSTSEDYAYCDRLSDITNTTVGKFANIAAMTLIGPTDHPMAHASLHHFLYRPAYCRDNVGNDAAFMAHRASRRTMIGPDTWLGHGVIVKPEVTIGAGGRHRLGRRGDQGRAAQNDHGRHTRPDASPPLRPRFAPALAPALPTG